jgi:hypothetical protein
MTTQFIMKYLVILIIFSLNFLVWRFMLVSASHKMLKLSKPVSYLLSFIFIFLIPYALCIYAFYVFELDKQLLSNYFFLFVLLLVSLSAFRKSFNTNEKTN